MKIKETEDGTLIEGLNELVSNLMTWDQLADRVIELEELLEDILAYMTGRVWHHNQSPDIVIKAKLSREE